MENQDNSTLSVEDAYQRRQRRRQEQREAAAESMRIAAGYRPSAPMRGAIGQAQNRLEHSR